MFERGESGMPWSGSTYGEFEQPKSILELHFGILIPLAVTDSIRHSFDPLSVAILAISA